MFNLAPVGMGRATFRLQEIIQIGHITSLIPALLCLLVTTLKSTKSRT